jgi:ribonuclease HI
MAKKVDIYTDGACSGNPGPGGWAAILVYGGKEKVLAGGEANTTNNRMELIAAISALEALKEPCVVDLYSDSRYLVDAINLGWARAWQARGWKLGPKGEAKNPDLWEKLLKLLEMHKVRFIWVKGHSENEYNKRCDSLAVAERKKF